MSSLKVVIDGVSIVIRGSFNPGIFSPAWFLAQKLIGNEEYEAAEVQFISRDLSLFHMGWLDCQVTQDAMQLDTVKPEETERLRDAAVAVLRLLSHTPINALGINRSVHFDVESYERWHKIGDRLAPKDIWEGVLTLPGTRNVTILAVRPDKFDGSISVQVEPSVKVPHGVYVAVNDHFTLTNVEEQPTTRSDGPLQQALVPPSSELIPIAVGILSDEWVDSMTRAEAIFRHVAKQGD